MDNRKFVIRETLGLLVGEAICTGLMFLVFLLLNRWDITVLLGGIAGLLITVGNFFFLAIAASLASDRAVNQDVEGAKKMVKASQNYRFIAIAVILLLCGASKACNLIALVIPLLVQRPIMLIMEFFRKKEV